MLAPLALPASVVSLTLPDQCQLIINPAPLAFDELPSSRRRTMKGERAKPIVLLIQHCSDIEDGLIGAQCAVALNIASHPVDDVR
jgi:hypothetical protein